MFLININHLGLKFFALLTVCFTDRKFLIFLRQNASVKSCCRSLLYFKTIMFSSFYLDNQKPKIIKETANSNHVYSVKTFSWTFFVAMKFGFKNSQYWKQ